MSRPDPRVNRVGSLQGGASLFDSRGFSRVKVTRDGTEEILELPIRSSGIWEIMEEMSRRAPRPPFRAEWVASDSDLGRQLGLDRDRPVLAFDTTDSDYLERLAAHHQEVLWRVLVAGMDLPFLDGDGRELAGLDDRRRVLRDSGLTQHQAERIFRDIQNLTRLEEEEEDFTSARS